MHRLNYELVINGLYLQIKMGLFIINMAKITF
jgi:hypothetical protein